MDDRNDVGAWGIQIITNGGGVGQPVPVTILIKTVPEPGTLLMLAIAGFGVLGIRRR